ncbi:uncharacterized protein [Ptychodera flava]|uniref:uncharacterized protein isoform X2 n=1 Tax=Ptychodera flava TaxID=63121 RepID=UPI003969C066
MIMSLPQGKMNHIMNHSAKVIHKQTVSVRELASLIGKMTASMAAVVPAPLQCRFLQMAKTKALINQNSYEAKVTLTSGCKEELQWWIEHLRDNNGKTLITPFGHDNRIGCLTDGLGSNMPGKENRGSMVFSREIHAHKCIGIDSSVSCYKNIHERENEYSCTPKNGQSSSCGPCDRMGGTKSPTLVNLSKEMWQYSLAHKIYLTAEYLPGVNNVIADWESRHVTDSSDWQLDPQIFKLINKQMGNLEVDLFASRINHQLEKYISWRPDPGAMATDALQISWGHMKGYAFPPFTLIARCLSKIRKEREHNRHDNPNMAHSTLVPLDHGNVNRLPHSPTNIQGTPHLTTPTSPSSPGNRLLTVSGLEGFRKSLVADGVSKETAELMSHAWRDGTASSYNSSWRKWSSWCGEQQINPFQTTLGDILNFLTTLYNEGYEYRTINTYRSTISAFHPTIDGFRVGQHPRVKMLLQAVFNSRPPQPRYKETWDVNPVLSYLKDPDLTVVWRLKLCLAFTRCYTI